MRHEEAFHFYRELVRPGPPFSVYVERKASESPLEARPWTPESLRHVSGEKVLSDLETSLSFNLNRLPVGLQAESGGSSCLESSPTEEYPLPSEPCSLQSFSVDVGEDRQRATCHKLETLAGTGECNSVFANCCRGHRTVAPLIPPQAIAKRME
jgi:hypothetical protein